MWPREYLESSTYESSDFIKLQSLAQLREAVGSAPKDAVLAAYDATAGYMQVPLPRPFILTTDDGKHLALDRLPFGIDAAAELFTLLFGAIAGVPGIAAESPMNVALIQHIDNVIGIGSPKAVTKWQWTHRHRRARTSCSTSLLAPAVPRQRSSATSACQGTT